MLAAEQALVDAPRALVHEQARGFDLDRHVGEHELDRLQVGDRLAEGLALARELQRVRHRAFRQAQAARADDGAAGVEREHRVVEALALGAADEVLARDAAVLEDDVGRRDAADAHLAVLSRDAEAGRVRGDDEAADALRARRAVGAREGDDVVGDGAAGDVHLLAVEDVVIAIADGPRLQVRGVGAMVGLGEAERALHLTRSDALADPLLLPVVAADHHRL